MTVRALAPCKVNPQLAVLGRRADGFHELRTWMLALELADVVEVERTDEGGRIDVEVTGPFASADVPRDETNLAVRAARWVLDLARERGAHRGGLRLVLTKNVPSQAGLGGASADAAAAVLAVEKELGLELAEDERDAALAGWGSDCVFFHRARRTGLALCEGRGEEVTRTPPAPRDWWVALLTPEVRCPTADVYAALARTLSADTPASRVRLDLFDRTAKEARAWLFNHLEKAAHQSTPELLTWREALSVCEMEHFLLSGSGSSFFGLFEDADDAARSLESIRSEAGRRGLGLRSTWVTRPAGAGARLITES